MDPAVTNRPTALALSLCLFGGCAAKPPAEVFLLTDPDHEYVLVTSEKDGRRLYPIPGTPVERIKTGRYGAEILEICRITKGQYKGRVALVRPENLRLPPDSVK